MAETMKVPVLTAARHFERQPYTIPEPAPDEVLVKVSCCGICGSDIHAYHGEHPFMPPPLILGHEFAGTVKKKGKNVTSLDPGDRVTVEPVLTCGRCINCLTGRYNVCLERKVIGCQSTGAYSGLFCVPAARVVPLPESVSFEAGAVVEPLAVGVHAIRRAGIQPGEKILVLGAGTIGLLTASVARAYGGEPVAIVDRVKSRLGIGERLGLSAQIDFGTEDLEDRVCKVFGPDGPDLIADCVGGNAAAFSTALKIARPGTRILTVGIFEPECKVPHLANLVENELDCIGTSIYRKDDFEEAVRLIAEGKVDATQLITHRYPLSQLAEAYRFASDRGSDYIKIMLDIKG